MYIRTFRISASAAAGMALAGGLLVAPGVAAGASGRVALWGYNYQGQLGNGTRDDSEVPTPLDRSGVLAGKAVTAISSGGNHSCVLADGKVYCWGDNTYGQLGNGSNDMSLVPVPVNTDNGPLAGKTVTAISTSWLHTCALADGKAYCWGSNTYGQLGNGEEADSSTVPVAVDTSDALKDKVVTAISTGGEHTCALADGEAYCWGNNAYGQLGNASYTRSKVPVVVKSDPGPLAGKKVTAISTGYSHTCALADDWAYCWGENSYGQLGDGTKSYVNVPVAVDPGVGLVGKAVTAISSGAFHTCALAGGQAFCWGRNNHGQLGNNSTATESLVPVQVDTSGPLGGATVTAIRAGYLHSCAVADGRASCWGNNWYGQLGKKNKYTDSLVPLAVDTDGVLKNAMVTAISTGFEYSAVLFTAAPQPPTDVSGVAGDGQVTVSWAPPADDGGSPIEEYTATAAPGGATCSTGNTSCVLSGLTNGTPYTFTVTARNAIGASAPSAQSGAVTPLAPVNPPPVSPPPVSPPPVTPVQAPAKVTGLKSTVRKGTVKVTWMATPSATNYRVRISKPGGKKYLAWRTTTKRVFQAKVKKGKRYHFQVAAIGDGGQGPVTTIRFKGK